MTEQQERDLQSALVECRRFVSAAKLALEKHREEVEYNRLVEQCRAEGQKVDIYGRYGAYPRNVSASLAAAKRASIDLWRALSVFRRRKDRQ